MNAILCEGRILFFKRLLCAQKFNMQPVSQTGFLMSIAEDGLFFPFSAAEAVRSIESREVFSLSRKAASTSSLEKK